MDYRAQEVFQAAAAVARKGVRVVRLHSVKDDCNCTCWKGSSCGSPGKHPIDDDWPSHATADEEVISDWFDYSDSKEANRINVGVKLGKDSGIVDIEFDNDEAEATLKRFGLDKIQTPTYKASRGSHRLFKWEADLPDVARVKVDSLEVHVGGDGKGVQSVMPYSWHRTGTQYAWEPGLSFDEVEPAPIPEAFKEAIRKNSKEGGSGVVAQAKAVMAGNLQVRVGERHGYLLGVATWLCQKIQSFTQEDLQIITRLVLLENSNLPTPKTIDEVTRIAADQFSHYQNKMLERRNNLDRPYERYGLEWNAVTREWDSGGWRLRIIYSDPVEYQMEVPSNGRLWTVSMNSGQFLDDKEVSKMFMDCGGKIDVGNPTPEKWRETWLGKRVRDGDGWRTITGLKCKLIEEAEEIRPSVDACQWSQHAAILLCYLRPFSRAEEDDDEMPPCQDGTPRWIKKDGRWQMFFKWHEMLRLAWRNQRAPLTVEQERVLKRKIIEITGETDFQTSVYKRENVSLGRFKVWGPQHLAALDQLTGA